MADRAREGPSTMTVVRIVVTVAITALLLYSLRLVSHVIVLIVISIFLAFGLDPAVRRLEKLGLKRGQAVAAIFLTFVVFIVGFMWAVVPPLVRQVTSFATDLPDYLGDLAERYPRVEEWLVDNDIPQRLQDAVSNVPKAIGGSFGNVLGFAGSVLSTLFNLVTVLILTIYFLLSLSRIREGSLKLIPGSKRDEAKKLMDPILEKIGEYIAGQVLVALVAGILAGIFLTIVGVPFPVALALWVTFAALIPLVGATVGAIPAVIVAFFDSVGLGIGTLVYFIVYQQIENYIIHPRIMNRAVDISPAAVLLAALIGGSLLGFVGALMAIPAAASIKLIFNEVVYPRIQAA
ncbi:MAG TPA: AI-2E family transporter [Actinomycetota bacterium]|nr:AI-2E family transporter [Actinomycetota bacterium]